MRLISVSQVSGNCIWKSSCASGSATLPPYISPARPQVSLFTDIRYRDKTGFIFLRQTHPAHLRPNYTIKPTIYNTDNAKFLYVLLPLPKQETGISSKNCPPPQKKKQEQEPELELKRSIR